LVEIPTRPCMNYLAHPVTLRLASAVDISVARQQREEEEHCSDVVACLVWY